MGYRFLVTAIAILALMQFSGSRTIAQELARPLTFSAPQFQIEDLAANVHSDGHILVVSGKVKNLSYSEVRGFVTIYFKGASHSVLKAVEVEVNDNNPIPNGQTGYFETSTNVESIGGLANVSVEFTETGRKLY